MFDFLKKGESGAIPDVGQEDKFEEKKVKKASILKKVLKKKAKATKAPVKKKVEGVSKSGDSEGAGEVSDAEAKVAPVVKPGVKAKVGVGATPGVSKLELDRVNARVEALQSLLKGYNERFSMIGQQIGEVRAMNLATEKTISRSKIESAKAADIVKEVKPDKLRLDYQKMDMKVTTLSEKIEANNQYAKTIMNEVKDLRQKAQVFLGTDAILQLNDDVKKDLIELQKLSARVRINADKSEQLFIELREGFADSQKLAGMVTNLDSFTATIKEEVDKLKLDHSQIINQKEYGAFQKTVNNKFLGIDATIEEVEKIKSENERLSKVIESIFSVVKKNQDEVGELGLNIGKSGIKKVDDYDGKLLELLRVMEKIAGEVKELKGERVKSVGVKKVVKPSIVKKESVSEVAKPIKKTRGVRDVATINESAKKSVEKPKPLKPLVPVKKVAEPKIVKKEVKGEKLEIDSIENELRDIRKNLGFSDVKKKKTKIVKKEVKSESKPAKKKIDVKGSKKRNNSWIKKAMKTRKENARKKEELKISRLKNLKKARAAKKRLKATRLKNLKKARAARKKSLKKKK
ncbi:hypothetical protein HOD75_02190 [archaeon]|jgi:hypothetical protein|nr:hypothetical protein [archaeon]MBT4241687.1 hypothetical protein [archaeon]MBT4418235.1 hypothetical protein [archaeon]